MIWCCLLSLGQRRTLLFMAPINWTRRSGWLILQLELSCSHSNSRDESLPHFPRILAEMAKNRQKNSSIYHFRNDYNSHVNRTSSRSSSCRMLILALKRPKSAFYRGRGTIFSQIPIKIRGFQNFNSHPSNSEVLSRIFTKLVIRHHTRTEKIALVYGSGRLNMAFRMTDFAARSSLFML